METIMNKSLSMAVSSVFIGEELNEGQEIDLMYNIVVFW